MTYPYPKLGGKKWQKAGVTSTFMRWCILKDNYIAHGQNIQLELGLLKHLF